MGGREGRADRHAANEREIRRERAEIGHEDQRDGGLVQEGPDPGDIEAHHAEPLGRELEAELPHHRERDESDEAHDPDRSHCPAHPTRATPVPISMAARARSAVTFSPKKMRPPIITARMLMQPTSTPLESGTSDRKDSQARNSAAKAVMPSQSTGRARTDRQKARPEPESAWRVACFNARWPVVSKRRSMTQMRVA